MKKKIFILLSLFSIVGFSCEDNHVDYIEPNKLLHGDIDALATDSRFQKTIVHMNSIINNKSDLELAKMYLSKEILSESDMEKLSIALGFDGLKEYHNYLQILNDNLSELEKIYKISSMSQGEIESAILQIQSSQVSDNSRLVGSFDDDQCLCTTIGVACNVAVTAGAVLGHIGCGFADITVILGVVCHASVVTLQMSSSAVCIANQINCMNTCVQQQ